MRLSAEDFPRKTRQQIRQYIKMQKSTKEKEKVNRKDLAEGEQSGPKKLSKFLD